MSVESHQQTYAIEFDERDWDEIVELGFEPFEIEHEQELTRKQWLAVAHMALGKVCLIDQGRYGMVDEEGEEVDDGVDLKEWADQLRYIADEILELFQPGDGKL